MRKRKKERIKRLVSLHSFSAALFFPLVEIERESNRGKLESFRAIKSGLIFNKSTFLGGAGNVVIPKRRAILEKIGEGGRVGW